MIRPVVQKTWELRPPVSVEFSRGQHGKAWAPPNTLGRILARVLHTEAARMARCSLLARLLHAETTRTARRASARRKTAKTKNGSAYRACVKLPACAGTGFRHSRSRLLQVWQPRTAAVGDPPRAGYIASFSLRAIRVRSASAWQSP